MLLQVTGLHLIAKESFPGENARSWGALGEARPGQSSLSAGALRYRAWAQSWSSAALATREESGVLGFPSRRGLTLIPQFSVRTVVQASGSLLLEPHYRPEKPAGPTDISTSGLSPCKQLERQTKVHSSTED